MGNLRKDTTKTTNKNKTPGTHVFLKRVVFSLKMLSGKQRKNSVGVQLQDVRVRRADQLSIKYGYSLSLRRCKLP